VTANFWAGATVAVALAAIAVSVILWLRGSPQRLLLYSLGSETALLSGTARLQAGPDLEVTLRGEALDDPHVVSVRVESRSRRDIRSADFENGGPLKISLGSPVLRTLNTDTGGEAMPRVPVGTEGSTVLVGPGLIKPGQVISIDLLTDGAVALTCPSPALADVSVRMSRPSEEPEPKWLRRSQLSGLGLLLVSVVIAQSLGPANKAPASLVLIFGALFLSGLIILTVPTVNHALIKRQRRRSS
jgi:hypothetical protein